MIDLAVRENAVLAGLKDFQLATVNRVEQLFTDGFHRVLVADEVGLGKTLVAKGVVARMARKYYEQAKKDEFEKLKNNLFKVVYVCSNQSIAGQNLKKLKVHENVKIDGLSDTRLSMQHLKIYEHLYDEEVSQSYLQLIPLTPGTSFSMTGGCGSVRERALIFAVIKSIPFFKQYLAPLEELMVSYATVSWGWVRNFFEAQVAGCDRKSQGQYLSYMVREVQERLCNDPSFREEAEQVLEAISLYGYRSVPKANDLILRLRKTMAEISLERMDADLVIMDEFQRFPELLRSEEDNEATMLARKFFNPAGSDKKDMKVLLLSATPYKLYSTLEEIQENQKDEHYEEFMQVLEFLFENQPLQMNNFKTAWKNYSVSLKEFLHRDSAAIITQKQQAEEVLYNGICRTERLKVPGAIDLVDSKDNNHLQVHEDDILAYADMDRVLEELELRGTMPVEYIKSAPLIMSFMQNYKVKHDIQEEMKAKPEKLPLLNSPRLWINKNKVAGYKPLNIHHARFEKLKETVLYGEAARLLWVLPSLPYYELGGPFRNQENFSKTLVFSAWEMVPRAVSTLISYEAERLTVGTLIKKIPGQQSERRSYFPDSKNKRFPPPRVTFSVKDNEPANMNYLCLLHPSVTLASMYDPIEAMNRDMSIKDILREVQDKIKGHLDGFRHYVRREGQRQDERWYYMAPLLMGRSQPRIQEWFKNPVLQSVDEDHDGVVGQEEDSYALSLHLERLKNLYQDPEQVELGLMPEDLARVLTNMAIASPAICALRMLGPDTPRAVGLSWQLAKTIVDRFNTQEAIAMVDLSYGKAGEGVHWKNILRYCLDGNLQAVLDEYAHMLLDGHDMQHCSPEELEKRNQALVRDMIRTLKTHTASYNVDTYPAFRHRVKNYDRIDLKKKQIRMRSSYAVGFYDMKDEGKSGQRKENIRLSFNSPFRPFVLTTTSIGQEGLDFHYYCRKIFHWNLPGNPIDLEQREGRINRYKCHAIRQNIAFKYGKNRFYKDVWQEMFDHALLQEKSSQTSDLVPFWRLTGQDTYNPACNIERIVPLYPLSRDSARYERLIKILSLYRLSLGQTRQEELIEYLFENGVSQEEVEQLFMNLSPYFKGLSLHSVCNESGSDRVKSLNGYSKYS